MTWKNRLELESDIVRHLDTGDLSGAACAILGGYGVEILAYLAAVTRNETVADDVFSAFSEDLWRGLPRFRRESSVRTWLYHLAWHALLRHRDDAFARRRAPLPPDIEGVAQDIRSRTASFLRTEVKDAVSRLREQLDPREQTLLILRVDRGLSWHEVAEVLSTPAAPVNEALLAKRFERIKAKLRLLAEEAGLLRRE